VRPSEEDLEMDARVKQGKRRVFISFRVLTSDAAIAELEEGKRPKGQRQARRPRRIVVEAVPPIGAGVDDDNFQAGDDQAFEGRRIVVERALAAELGEVDDVFF
jgi:hypothetical protein